jgi:hypothetical protein
MYGMNRTMKRSIKQKQGKQSAGFPVDEL